MGKVKVTEVKTVAKTPKKKWYMKDEFFNKSEIGVKGKGSKNVKSVSREVDYKRLTIGNVLCVFVKDKALTSEELVLFTDGQNNTFNQRAFYLIEK